MLAKVQRALDSVNTGLSEAVVLLEENRPRINRAMASVEHAAATVDADIAGPIAQELDEANPRSLLAEVHTAFGQLNRSLADLNVVSEKGRRMVVLNEERVNRLVVNAKEASAHLKGLAKDLRRNPWRFLHRPSSGETKELAIMDAAREFSEAAGRLDDSAAQLRALMAANDEGVAAEDPELAALREELQQTFERFREAEQALWKRLGE